MSDFPVTKEHPIPPKRAGAHPKYPFHLMEVGDSFDAPRDMGKDDDGRCRRRLAVDTSARGYCRRHNPKAKFTTRIFDKDTVRCWRIK